MTEVTEISARAASIHLGVGLGYVYHLLWAAKLPGRKTDGEWRIPLSAVEARLRAKADDDSRREHGQQ